MMNYFLTIARHFIAIAVGWLVTSLTSVGVALSPEQILDIHTAITGIGVIVFTAVYVAVEKALKSWWVKLGEKQPN